jgi:hypothetical protein
MAEFCDSSVWIEISAPNGQKPIVVASIYVTPDSDKSQFLQQLSLLLSSPFLLHKNLIIMGDVNINWNVSSPDQRLLQHTLDAYGLTQHSVGVTYVSYLGNETLLDHNYVSQNLQVLRCQILTCDRSISDHYATLLQISHSKPSKAPRTIINSRGYHKFDPFRFHQDAIHLPLLRIASSKTLSISERVEQLDSHIQVLLDLHLPLKQIRVRGPKKEWLNHELLHLIRLKNQYYKKIFRAPGPISDNQLAHYHKFKNYVINQIRRAKKQYFSQKLSESSASFYKCLRQFSGKQKSNHKIGSLVIDGKESTDDAEIADAMNTYFTSISSRLKLDTANSLPPKQPPLDTRDSLSFVPISCDEVYQLINSLNSLKKGGVNQVPTLVYKSISDLLALPLSLLINESLESGIFPDHLKTAVVSPIHKKGDRKNPTNYRPISSLPILSKVFETVIKNQLLKFLEKEHLLSDRQFGFRKNHSSEQLLLSLLSDWRSELDHKTPLFISALSLDVRKAFDTVNHDHLVSKLPNFRLSTSAIQLIRSYLSNRSQVMKVGSVLSSSRPITCGVPQGSILGPILFLLTINDLLLSFPASFAYADDTLIFSKGSTVEQSVTKCKLLLQQVATWYQGNLLQLNLDKTQFCIFSNRKILSSHSIQVSDTIIQSGHSMSLLGVKIDSELSFSPHIESLSKRANGLVYLTSRFRRYLNVEQAKLTYTSIVRPILEYCSSLFLTTSQKNASSLERVQNRAIRIILSAPRSFSVTSGRALLNLPTLASRRKYLFHKFLHQRLIKRKVSRYILNLSDNCKSHSLSLRRKHALIKPYFRTNMGKGSLPSQLHTFLVSYSQLSSALLSFEL